MSHSYQNYWRNLYQYPVSCRTYTSHHQLLRSSPVCLESIANTLYGRLIITDHIPIRYYLQADVCLLRLVGVH